MNRFRYISLKRIFSHLLFWLCFYILYVKLGMAIYPDLNAVLIIYLGKIFVQAIAAYVLVYVLMPFFLDRQKYILFIIFTLAWTYFAYILLVISRADYLEPMFLDYFRNSTKHVPFLDIVTVSRIRDLNAYLDAVPWLFTPAAFMGLVKFYKNRLRVSSIEKEKRNMELIILKNQLNPHFLFNTLNNLYMLTLKKDDKAPEGIARLSEILDFILYKCNDQYVDLFKEIELLENYISLEKLRYGEDRLQIKFNKTLSDTCYIAPLLLVTLLENAFKHGVVNELEKAEIHMDLIATHKVIRFSIANTKPVSTFPVVANSKSIGLENIRKQLNLLYPSRHVFEIKNNKTRFMVNLVLHEI